LRGKTKATAARQPVEGGAISLLAAGAESQDAIPLLGSPGFAALLSELRSQTMVVVDAAPLESGPEAEILAAAADGVVLVVCADRTTEQEAQLAAARLSAAAGGPLLGVVLNQARRGEMLLGGAALSAEDWLATEATEARAPR
jgi:Mrp family chromosome partitioning ATPase